VTSQAERIYADTAAESRSERIRLTTLTPEGMVRTVYDPDRLVLSDSLVTFDRTREIRRRARIEIVDDTGRLAPSSFGDEFAPGSRVRLERGVVAGAAHYVLVGEFQITGFDITLTGRLTLRAEDPYVSLRQDFGDAFTLAPRTTGAAAVRGIFGPILGSTDDWRLEDGSAAIGSSRTFAEDDERLSSGVDLMADLGLETYADRGGQPVLEPISDPNDVLPLRTYEQAPGVALATDLTRSGDVRPINRQIVVGEPPGGDVVRGVSEISDSSHPAHSSRIGVRTGPVYRSAQITSQHQANDAAKARLLERSLFTDAAVWVGVPDLTLEAGDVVAIVSPTTGTDSRYRIDRLTLPLGLGPMTIYATRVVPLFAVSESDG